MTNFYDIYWVSGVSIKSFTISYLYKILVWWGNKIIVNIEQKIKDLPYMIFKKSQTAFCL